MNEISGVFCTIVLNINNIHMLETINYQHQPTLSNSSYLDIPHYYSILIKDHMYKCIVLFWSTSLNNFLIMNTVFMKIFKVVNINE